MDAFEVLHTRRSIRQFLNRPVGEDLVKELLSAAMSAPTAGGIQPWRFVVITDREKLDKIPDFHPYAGMIKQAPVSYTHLDVYKRQVRPRVRMERRTGVPA